MGSNKFAGYCVVCCRRVRAGHGELARSSSGAWVVRCGGGGGGGMRKGASAPPAPKKPDSVGDVGGDDYLMSRPFSRRPDISRELGKVFRGGSAHRIGFVLGAEARYQSSDDNEDFGDMMGGGWRIIWYVRPATDAEAAPVLAGEAAEAAKAAAMAEVRVIAQRIRVEGIAGASHGGIGAPGPEPLPSGDGVMVWVWERGCSLYISGDVIHEYELGGFDDFHTHRYIQDAAVAADVRRLHGIIQG